MANTFVREPISGGDSGAWASYTLAQMRAAQGVLTALVTYDGLGGLQIGTGMIGINNGADRGICDIGTVTAISLAAANNNEWLLIEVSISGTNVVFNVTNSGYTDIAVLPAQVGIGYYQGAKGGFYYTPTKRIIAVVWKTVAGLLLVVRPYDSIWSLYSYGGIFPSPARSRTASEAGSPWRSGTGTWTPTP